MAHTRWWKDEVVYQVYPRSFQDTNNDGIGDLPGVISHLDYLKDLGVTMIWLSPIYKSPMVDMGYDIADYQAIDPQFGTMDDFDELLAEAKKRDIKIVMDLVVNHTSDQHEWFQKALADKNSPYRDYYIFKTTEDGEVPNNWRAIFGGSTWTEVPGEPGTYYFHTFAPQQPELNWENPALREEIYDMINWWLDKGVAGWRVDAITHLKKDLDWASIPADGDDGLANVVKKGQNRPGINVFLDELKEKTFDKYDAITIGEAYGVPEADLPSYIGPDGYFSMIFDFSYMNIEVADVNEWYLGASKWTTKDLKDILFNSQKDISEIDGWSGNVLENHDQPRVLSKLVPDKANQTPTAAKALATMYYFLPGVPFIYQGQEIGMKNFERQSIEEFNDVSSINNYEVAMRKGYSKTDALETVNKKSRDNARTPMQWNDSEFGGFSDSEPWLAMGTDLEHINVAEEQTDEQSVLRYYQAMAQLRQDSQYHANFIDGTLTELKNVPDNVIAYQRELDGQIISVYVNLGADTETVSYPNGSQTIVLQNRDDIVVDNGELKLPAYSAIVLAQ
ncbi:glycoside hydrolase family 13 protein [Weissella minor]|uniref:glycoside hydrolase family 13 protein n=1 Tax=Weissella minor TaxID=1620 RepID=UPI003AF311B3